MSKDKRRTDRICKGLYDVYVVTNTANDKRYIGLSCNTRRRWKDHISTAHNPNSTCKSFLHSAIRKYGVDSFVFEKLAEGLPRHQASDLELRSVALFNTTNPKYGYNLKPGGYRGKAPVPKGTGEKISKATLGKKKNLSPQEREAKSARTKKEWEPGGIFRSIKYPGGKPTPVLCVETNTIYPGVSHMVKELGFDKTNKTANVAVYVAMQRGTTYKGFTFKLIKE
jgi:group I intron endonuclease